MKKEPPAQSDTSYSADKNDSDKYSADENNENTYSCDVNKPCKNGLICINYQCVCPDSTVW